VKLSETNLGFIGAGNMASALMRGLIAAHVPASRIFAVDVDAAKLSVLTQELGISSVQSVDELVARCDVILVATKPSVVLEVLQGRPGTGPLFISIAAGITLGQLEGAFAGPARVVRAMPNTAALVAEAATGFCGGHHLRAGDLELAEQLLGVVGLCVRVEEKMLDAVTGLSGSGPAYVMLVIEAMADGGVRAGLPREVALRLATQTVRGAATLVQQTGKHPAELKDMVTSPGGTTICGVQVLEQRGIRGAFIDAVQAATLQSSALSKK